MAIHVLNTPTPVSDAIAAVVQQSGEHGEPVELSSRETHYTADDCNRFCELFRKYSKLYDRCRLTDFPAADVADSIFSVLHQMKAVDSEDHAAFQKSVCPLLFYWQGQYEWVQALLDMLEPNKEDPYVKPVYAEVQWLLDFSGKAGLMSGRLVEAD